METIDRTQLMKDLWHKEKMDAIAAKWGYKAGKLDTEEGTLVYQTYHETELTAREALKHICFLNELHDTFSSITTTSRFGVVTITLPEAQC